MAAPSGLSISAGEEGDAMNMSLESPTPLERKASFDLSDTGTFKKQDFAVGRNGLSRAAGRRTHGLSGVALHFRDFDVLEELGQGASGLVHKARHRPTGTVVAIKTVNISDKGKRDQTMTELRSLISSTCPYLVSLYEAFYEDMQVHMILEFMDGGDLQHLVRSTAASGGIHDELTLYKIATQVLCGLNYLHRQRHQLHRDLKPANIMLTSEGLVKISDFGITSELDSTMGMATTFVGGARAWDGRRPTGGTHLSAATPRAGTMSYMSPERLSGERYSYPSDMWSFGLVMLELATGRYPFQGTNYFALLNRITQGPPPDIPTDLPLTEDFRDFVKTCLEKEPMRRPTVTELQRHPWMRRFGADEMDLSMKLDDFKL